MILNAVPYDRQFALAPLDEKVDHVRGSPTGRLIIEYGDYECPYSGQAFHAIDQVEQQLERKVRFAFRYFPLANIHPHALAAAATAEAAARQDRFWDMHALLFHRQKALEMSKPQCCHTCGLSAFSLAPSSALLLLAS
jgi:protein-disulfide isomerase